MISSSNEGCGGGASRELAADRPNRWPTAKRACTDRCLPRLSPSARQERAVEDADSLTCAEQVVGYEFKDRDLLNISLTHSSIADSRVVSNERLEFLGDAILGMVVCEELYSRFDAWLEGDLTKAKSSLVSRRICAQISDDVGLTKLLILGNGIGDRGQLPVSLRAAVYESLIGAIYLDGGLAPARAFILRTMETFLDECDDSANHRNFKSALQQLVQQRLATTPHYEQLDEQGPDHLKCFEISVVIGGEQFPSAWGTSKKDAEQKAALSALDVLRERFGLG